jgi:hypothetical protein
MAQTATFRKSQYNGSAIKKQEGGSPDLTRVGRMRESKCVRQNVPWPINKDKSGRKTCVRFFLIAHAILAFAATMTIETTDANAVVCARGVHRAGCAGYRGAVVVRRPPSLPPAAGYW